MKPTQQLTAFWNWLPAFRVVAETEHLPTASKMLHLTPSALSRTIRLLEDAIGEQLFDRKGRGLVLSPAGEEFLSAVRTAMRTVHDGMLSVQNVQYDGPLHISSPAPFASVFLLPALKRLQEKQPGLVPHLHSLKARSSLNLQLRQGSIDVVLVDDPLPDAELTVSPLFRLFHDVYCSPEHPLAGMSSEEAHEQLTKTPFVAPVPDSQGVTPDAWPTGHPRVIGLRVTRMNVALAAVHTGDFVAILPNAVAKRASPKLVRLRVPDLAPTTLFMVHRPRLNMLHPSRAELLISEIKAVAKEQKVEEDGREN